MRHAYIAISVQYGHWPTDRKERASGPDCQQFSNHEFVTDLLYPFAHAIQLNRDRSTPYHHSSDLLHEDERAYWRRELGPHPRSAMPSYTEIRVTLTNQLLEWHST